MTVTDRPGVRERRRADTRREILDAAWRLAEANGVAGLTLRDLAREVGMRAPSLYTYFDNKAAIYDAMFAEGYRQALAMADELAQREPDPADPAAALTAAAVMFLRFCQESIARYQLMFTRAIPGWEPSPEAYAVSIEFSRRGAEFFATLGIEGQREIDLYTAVTAGLAAQQIANDPGGDRWVNLVRDVVEMYLNHLRRAP